MRKINTLLAIFLLVIATMVLLVACGEKENPENTAPTQEQLSQNTPTTEVTTQPTQGTPTEESKPEAPTNGEGSDGNGTTEEPPVQQAPTTPPTTSPTTPSTTPPTEPPTTPPTEPPATPPTEIPEQEDPPTATNQAAPGTNLTWDAINSYPIKTSSMTVEEIRKLCVDFFRFSKTAVWSPDETFSFSRNSGGTRDSMSKTTTYGGLPYVGSASGNVYRLMDYLDEATGKVDISDALALTGSKLDMSAIKYFGNQCSYGAWCGWARVINSATKRYTEAMTPAWGYIPLGNYTTLKGYNYWNSASGRRTSDITTKNGEQVMYQSYGLLQPADGLVYYTTAGHTLMCSQKAHVEYKADGTIDGNQSYVYVIHQAQTWETRTDNGTKYQIKDGVDVKRTFKQLYDSGYIPFTFAEFTGADDVEKTEVSFSYSGSTINKNQLFNATITTNYSITDAYITLTDSTGKEVYKHAVRNPDAFYKSINLVESGENVDKWGSLTSGTYTVKIEAQLGTGERPTVYTGIFTL